MLKAQAEVLIYEHREGKKRLIHRQKLNTFTMNFIHMVEAMLRSMGAGEGYAPSLTDMSGTAHYVMFQGAHDPEMEIYIATDTREQALRSHIRIGSSSTPETRNDYALGDEKMASEASVGVYNSLVKASASFTPDTDITVREVGLSKQYRDRDTGSAYDFLLLRGVITERTFSAGTTYTVEIRISFT